MDEFVVCPSCGTRIKSGREFCLRCFGPLPTLERPVKPPIWVSLGLSDTKKQVVAIAIAGVVIGLGALIYVTEPPGVDETARPAVNVPPSRQAPASVAPVSVAPSQSSVAASAESDDTSRVAAFELLPARSEPTTSVDLTALEEKRKMYESELAKSPDDVGLLNDLAVALTQLGRPGDAIPRFERAASLAPDQARIHTNFGNALTAAGLWDRAIVEYREAVRLRPENYLAQYTLGAALHRKGDEQAAIVELQKAVKLAPNEASARLTLGVSLEAFGRRDEAVKEYLRFLQLQPNAPDAARLRAHLQTLGSEASKVQ